MTAGTRKLRTLTSYAALARFVATVDDTDRVCAAEVLPHDAYAYSLTHTLYRDPAGRLVTWIETRHKRYEVWSVAPQDARKRREMD